MAALKRAQTLNSEVVPWNFSPNYSSVKKTKTKLEMSNPPERLQKPKG